MAKKQFVNNPEVRVSYHAKIRFLERLAPDISPSVPYSGRLKFAEQTIKEIWTGAAYYSDNEKGIVFYNAVYKACLCVKNRVITTINKAVALRDIAA
jgi:hypothetical protein